MMSLFNDIYALLALALWLPLLLGWAYISFSMFLEHKDLKRDSSSHPTQHYILARLAGLQRRNLQLWALVSVLLLIGFLQPSPPWHQPPPAAAPAEPAAVLTPEPAPSAIAPTPVEAPQAAAAEPPAKATPALAMPATTALPYSDITEFSEKDSKQQAYLDYLKQRYENWLITHYYLSNCGKAQKDDLDIILKSLRKELVTLNTEIGSFEENILLAANGSYNELYRSISCDDERVSATKAMYDVYMQQAGNPPVSAGAAQGQPAAAGQNGGRP